MGENGARARRGTHFSLFPRLLNELHDQRFHTILAQIFTAREDRKERAGRFRITGSVDSQIDLGFFPSLSLLPPPLQLPSTPIL